MAAKIKSPCVKRCRVDRRTGWCAGCWRSREEISGWKRLTDDGRQQVLHAIALRRAEAVPAEAPGRAAGAGERRALAQALRCVLADTYALWLKTHGFRWNLDGPLSDRLQPLLDDQRAELGAAVDQIAARIRALGATAPGSLAALARLSSVREAGRAPPTPDSMARKLARDQQGVVRTARAALKRARKAGDAPSAELLAQRVQAHEQAAGALGAVQARP